MSVILLIIELAPSVEEEEEEGHLMLPLDH